MSGKAHKHTWTLAERQRASKFAGTLKDSRLVAARSKAHLPFASAEKIVQALSEEREQLSRLCSAFDVTRSDVIDFFLAQKPNSELRLTKLKGAPLEDLLTWLIAYVAQVSAVSELDVVVHACTSKLRTLYSIQKLATGKHRSGQVMQKLYSTIVLNKQQLLR